MNKSRFEHLPPEVQAAIREAADAWSAHYAKAQAAAAGTMLQNMVQAGAKVSELSEAERKRWADSLSPVGKTWAADAQGKGLPGNEVLNAYTSALVKAGAKMPRDWTK